jgi:hypothetical protein
MVEVDAELKNAGYMPQGSGSYANQFGERIAIISDGETGIIATEYSTKGEAVHSEKFYSEETMRASGLFARLYVERSMMDMLAPNEPVLMKFRERVRGWFTRSEPEVPLDLLDAAERTAVTLLLKYSEDQPRDELGRWGSGTDSSIGPQAARSAHIEAFVGMGMSDQAKAQLSASIVAQASRMDAMLPPTYERATDYAASRTAPVPQEATDAAAPAARAILTGVQAAQQTVGPAVAIIADELGGSQEGLQYETKTEDSLTRKIAVDMMKEGSSATDAAANIYDGLRYTIVVPEESYSEDAARGRDMLEQMGYLPVKAEPNTGGPYVGYNTTWTSPETGVNFEVQFHTADSYFIKEAGNHAYYAAARVADSESGDDVLKAQATSKMDAFGALIPVPAGISNLPTYDNR